MQIRIRNTVEITPKDKKNLFLKVYNKFVFQNGFFVEAGAGFCDHDSITLPFEIHFNWTGKMIKPSSQHSKV